MGNPFEQLQQHTDERFALLESKLDGIDQLVKKLINSKEYTISDIAEKTNSDPQTVRKLLKESNVELRRFGRKFIISQQEFDKACEVIKTTKYKR